jgi:integrase
MRSMLFLARRYLVHRRKLGFILRSEGRMLLDFARFADRMDPGKRLTTALILRWTTGPQTPSAQLYHAKRLEVVRGFAKYCAALDPKNQVPDRHLLPSAHQRVAPHIFTEQQVRLVMRRARNLSTRGSPLRPLTYQTLIGLIACTGLRPCEARRLRCCDFDARAGTLHVPAVKCSPARTLPIHATTVRALYRYRHARLRVLPGKDWLFVGPTGRPLSQEIIRNTFARLTRGIAGSGARPTIRLQDLRHTFATRTIAKWSRQSEPVAHHLQMLSRYLGHQNFTSTWWYVSSDPDSLQAAAKRFGRFHRHGDDFP